MLEQTSWNLEPSHEKYKNAVVKKSIEKALLKNRCIEEFDKIAEKFILTEPRYDRKLFQLSGERWRASAALGMCFCILQLVMDDNEPVDRTESWRMADFYEYAIRIGRVMGYKESYIKKVLKKNRDFMNHQALLEEPVAVILLNYMEYSSEKNHTVSELLKIIKRLASELQIDLALLPKDPAALSRKINKLKSNLEDEGITYEIKNKGYAKVITIRNAKPRHEPINFS